MRSDGNLIMGTIDLFRLHRDAGVTITKEDARELLVNARGVFTYPPKAVVEPKRATASVKPEPQATEGGAQ